MKQDKVRAKDEPNSELATPAPQYTVEQIIRLNWPEIRTGIKTGKGFPKATAQLTTLLNKRAIEELELMKHQYTYPEHDAVVEAFDHRISELESELKKGFK